MQKKEIILLIEDEYDIADLMKDYLEESNYDVILARTRNEAFFKISNQKFDCIISDINLNQSDVIPLFKELRTNLKGINYGVPVIIHSGHVTGPIIKRNKEIIKKVFVKPTGSEEIINSLKKVIKAPKGVSAA